MAKDKKTGKSTKTGRTGETVVNEAGEDVAQVGITFGARGR